MKTSVKTILLLIICLFPYVSINGYEHEVTLIKAGKLSSEMKKKDPSLHIQKLKINGPINGTDLLFLKSSFSSSLVELDLTDATIVPGGKSYYETHIDGKKMKFKVTKEDALEMYSLSDFSFLKILYLPQNLKELEIAALKNCNSLEEIHFTGHYPPLNVSGLIHKSSKKTENEFLLNEINLSLNLPMIDSKSPICNKIIVPGDCYHEYTHALPIYCKKIICKDYAPSEYTINLSHDLKEYFEGGYEFVKRLTLIGKLTTSALKEIKKLPNLEYLNLGVTIIEDSNISKQMEKYLSSLVPKSQDLIDLEYKLKIAKEESQRFWVKKVNPIESKVLYLTGKLKTIDEERISKKKKMEDKQFERALISALIGISADDLQDKRNRGEIGEMEYSLNSMFLSTMDDELKKEMKGLDITNDEDFVKIKQSMYKELAICKDSLNKVQKEFEIFNEPLKKLESEINPITDKWKQDRTNMKKYINESSNIPTKFISKMDLPNLKTIILPKNTAIIASSAFYGYTSDLEVIINRDHIKIADKIIGM